MMKKTTLAIALIASISGFSHAGGILLHEVATFDSVSSAGVGNSTNRIDASSAITSPAGLTSVEDSSFSLGLQYLDAYSEHNGSGNYSALSSNGKNASLVPSLAYAKRVNDRWVLGTSLHGDGGLGMDYDKGLTGLHFVDDMAQEALNIHFAAGYQLNDSLSFGSALVIQHMMTSFDAGNDLVRITGEGGSTAASFILSAMYDLSDATYLSANYKHKVDHSGSDVDVDLTVGGQKVTRTIQQDVTWPSRFDLGIHHSLSNQLTLKAITGVELWSQFDDQANNVYSLGAALAYTQNDWVYQAGIKHDTAMYDIDNMSPELAIGANWSLGMGAEKTLSNGHRLGVAYQYRDLGTQDVTYRDADGDPYFQGSVDSNRIHVLSVSYAY
ncbi:long-chain fatty acid transport protein [Vibrio maritimus]|uniref:Long-chain fatty acid transport protein n=1 Tax=Vibrio maritimus TaxID=990268 RepID=A0A090RXZ3_9VIBR|nr:long-chain fatty acid transport protein [Vibrio maritimus]